MFVAWGVCFEGPGMGWLSREGSLQLHTEDALLSCTSHKLEGSSCRIQTVSGQKT